MHVGPPLGGLADALAGVRRLTESRRRIGASDAARRYRAGTPVPALADRLARAGRPVRETGPAGPEAPSADLSALRSMTDTLREEAGGVSAGGETPTSGPRVTLPLFFGPDALYPVPVTPGPSARRSRRAVKSTLCGACCTLRPRISPPSPACWRRPPSPASRPPPRRPAGRLADLAADVMCHTRPRPAGSHRERVLPGQRLITDQRK
ncbi:hypothetical protein LT493_42130 [Streptomyces tricolor]|nr:hypothetical protein [Streptomyces tricolor]